MTHAYSVSTKARAFALAVAIGLSVSGIVALAGGAASAPSAAQPCPTPTGGQSPTATACPSPTGTTTTTTTTTPTGTVSPTGTTTATSTTSPGTGSPTGTTTVTSTVTGSPGSPGPGSRTITLEASSDKKTYGKSFTLSGGISSPSSQCVTAQVEIFRTVVGSQTQELFDTLSSGADGTFTNSYTADVSANYIAHVDASGTCAEANSEPAPVLVRVAVNLSLSKQRVAPGGRVRLRSSVLPCAAHAGTRVVLFRLIGGAFSKIDSARLNDDCRAQFTKRVRKSTAFQVRWPKQDADHLSGRSRKKAVQVTR